MRGLLAERAGRARGRAPRGVRWLGAFAAAACAGAGADLHGLPVCAEQAPAPDAKCELDPATEQWKRDAVLALWAYVGSELRKLPATVAFDATARVDTACLAPGASIPRTERENVRRGLRSLESMRRGPSCVAGRSLSLADVWAAEAKRWRGKRSGQGNAQNRCTTREFRCPGVGLPVCALREDGRWVEYPNRCEACRDDWIVGYDDRRCPGF